MNPRYQHLDTDEDQRLRQTRSDGRVARFELRMDGGESITITCALKDQASAPNKTKGEG